MKNTEDKNTLKCVPADTPSNVIRQFIEDDGGVVLMNLLSSDQVGRLNAEMDPYLELHAPGNKGDVKFTAEFSGQLTKRMAQMVVRSKVFREEVLTHEHILAHTDAILLPTCDSYWMSTAQIIEIQPGQPVQELHRDCEDFALFRKFGAASPDVLVNYLVALSEFTEEMGATRIVPGSHKWKEFETRDYHDQSVPVILEPGWAVLLSGKLMHCGGANISNRPRRAMALVYNLGWLTPEEAHPFVVPMEVVKTLSPRAQQLLGFRSFHDESHGGYSMWQVDYVDLSKHLGLPDAPPFGKIL